jgi:hypothetical protein
MQEKLEKVLTVDGKKFKNVKLLQSCLFGSLGMKVKNCQKGQTSFMDVPKEQYYKVVLP